jgi:NTE family protein
MVKKLTISGNGTNKEHERQRALVLQGGGALGAYEVGVIKTLYKHIVKEDQKTGCNNRNGDRPIFDVIAGTSIGAMNAAVLVGNVVHQRNSNPDSTQEAIWGISVNELEKFWKIGLVADVWPLDGIELWKPWQDGLHEKIKSLASKEAARRYYATKLFVFGGKKVFSTKGFRPDLKFLDPDNRQLILNDEPLIKKLDEFGKFPIRSCFDNAEPRLLVTAVDIANGSTVTFDSYEKLDGIRKSEYYPDDNYGYNGYTKRDTKNKDESEPVVIKYENGISAEHVMASGTLPDVYDPRVICNRKFWDGGLLSNTPLTELLESHRDYWINVEKNEQAPDLEVYIVNVHPSKIDVHEMDSSINYDFVKDRNNDIVYGDRSYKEQLSTAVMNDFIEFITDLKQRALSYITHENDKEAFEKDFDDLKNKKAENVSKNYRQNRSYEDLMRRVIRLSKVVRIERKYDPNSSMSLKTGDLTPETINRLIEEGEKDAGFI